MKILQINTVCKGASTATIANALYKSLEEHGHECCIAYGRGAAPDGIKTIRIGDNLDTYMHVAITRAFDKHGFGSKRATKEFIKKIEEYNPDVIHLHNIHGYYINIKELFTYLKKVNKPIVWTLHDCWPFTGHCAYFDYVECEKWKNECNRCPQKREYPKSLFIDNSKINKIKKQEIFTGIKNMTIVTPSEWLAKQIKDSFLAEYNIRVINNGIDLEVFKPTTNNFKKRNELDSKIVLLGVASIWDRRKGLNYFIELANRLEDTYKIVIVGVNEKQKKVLPRNLIAITRTNNVKDLVDIYSSADIFVNPTMEDNFPTTNLEAIACGTPIITFDAGGSGEVINEKCGKIVEKGNVISLINEIKSNEFSSKDCIDSSKKYDNKHIYKNYIHLYNELLI